MLMKPVVDTPFPPTVDHGVLLRGPELGKAKVWGLFNKLRFYLLG